MKNGGVDWTVIMLSKARQKRIY